MTRHLPLYIVIRHVRDILKDTAAGVHTVCPSLHGFRLQGNAYDSVWTMSVTLKVVSIQMSDLKNGEVMNMTTEIPHYQPSGRYALEGGFF